MLYESGKGKSLQDVGEKFIAFLQTSNDTTQAWELVDNRLDSFYGATLKIPLKESDSTTERYPCFYVSLQHTNVTSDTYYNWLHSNFVTEEMVSNNHASHTVYSTTHTNHYPMSESYSHVDNTGNGTLYNREIRTKYGSTYHENLFKNNGEFIAIGLHTLYDSDIWMCEQGGITCTREADKQINDLNLQPFDDTYNYYHGGWNEEYTPAPAFPGTGCPWLTKSVGDDSTFDVNTQGVKYWFTKTNYSATITISLSNYDIVKDAYQTISLGKLDSIEESSYKLPLYICGGSQGICHDVYNYHPYESDPYRILGNVYDISIRNPSMANANAMYPTKFNGSNTSNFKILSPNGEWEDIFYLVQSATVVQYYSCGADPYYWAYPLNAPTVYTDSHNFTYPAMNNYDHMIDTHAVNKRIDRYTKSSPSQKFMIGLDNVDKGICGTIPNMLFSWSRTMEAGEITINNKKYLSVPNGWEGRLKYYPWHCGRIYNDEWNTDTLRDSFENLYNESRDNMYVHTILIPLEGVD